MSQRLKVTVPAAGKTEKINLRGRSFAIENSPVYETPADVPIISKSNLGGKYPVYPRNVYGNESREFDYLTITGTDEAAGDEFDIYVTDECLDTVFNIVLSEQYKIVPGETFTKTANDAVVSFTELELMSAEGLLPVRVDVSVCSSAGNSGIKWALNADPVQGDDALGTLLKPGINGNSGLLEIPESSIYAFRFINAENTVSQTVNVIPYY